MNRIWMWGALASGGCVGGAASAPTGPAEPVVTSPVDGGNGEGGLAVNGNTAGGSGGDAMVGCRSIADCAAPGRLFNGTCALVVHPVCGGESAPGDCTTDADCADAGLGAICALLLDGCRPSSCRPKCRADADCADYLGGEFAELACDIASGHCGGKTCASDADCSANFSCQGTSTLGVRQCQRKPCGNDGDCNGFCIEGKCSAALGTCEATRPAPP